MFGLLKKRIMYIDVHIPFGKQNQLAQTYNRVLDGGSSEWVLFLDHDVFLCNPRWYEMCIRAISTLQRDPLAACVGCECGGEHHKRTMAKQGKPDDHIETHIKISKMAYSQYGDLLQRIHIPVPGFFMLLKREVAREIGFIQKSPTINNIDTDFGERLMKAGYHIYQMRGLYIYHRRGMKKLRKEFIIQK